VLVLALVCCCGGGFLGVRKLLADNPRTIASGAAEQVADVPALRLTGWVTNNNGPAIKADVSITATGEVSGTVTDALAGKAELRAAPGWTLVRGDEAWWASRAAPKAKRLAGRWVTPEPGTAFPVPLGERLNPRSIQTLVKNLASRESWDKAEEVTVAGRRLRQLTAGDWTLLVTEKDPHELVYLSGPLLSGRTGFAYGDSGPVRYRLAEGGAAQYPQFSFALAPQTPEEQRRTRAAVDEVKRSVPAEPPAQATPQPAPAALRPTVQIPPLCLTPVCTFSVTVTNAGGSAGTGTLHAAVSTGPALAPRPVTVAAGARVTQHYQFRNPAPPSRNASVRVPISVTAYVHTAQLEGSNPAVAKRLRDRGLDTAPLTRIGEPYAQTLVRAVDLMTQGTKPTDRTATLNAVRAAQNVVDANALPALAELVRHSNRLQNRADLPKLLNDIGRDNDPTSLGTAPIGIGERRVLEEVAQVLRDDPKVRIAWDCYVDIVHNGQPGRYRADYLRLDTREAYQIKTITATSPTRQHEAIRKRLAEATRQLNGDAGPATNGPAEQAPPGFAKVAKLRLEHQTSAYFLMSRDELVQVLRRVQVYPSIRDGRIDRLEIVNGFDGGTTHVWTEDELRRDLG
jgi:hypothetical protein